MAPKPEDALRLEPHCVRFVERSPWWGGDLQTIRNHLMRREQSLESHASVLEFPTSDGSGDRLTGTLERPMNPAKSPLIVLIHGLTGCEDSFYVRDSARFHLARGRSVLRLNLRGAGPSRRVAGGYYHAGCASDLEDVIGALGCEETRYGVFTIGYSLGGNILLNLLSRLPQSHRLVGAATVSAPIEPLEACNRIMAPRNIVYHSLLLRRMKRDVLSPLAQLSNRERQLVEDATSVFEFDDKFVAPRNGFGNALNYYERTASARQVRAITVPTLMLHACNDPWIPASPYRALQRQDLPNVEIVLTRSGGHVGFHERGFADAWYDRRMDDFISSSIIKSPGGY
jgi:predicted alpha/beta-fold hydrolase